MDENISFWRKGLKFLTTYRPLALYEVAYFIVGIVVCLFLLWRFDINYRMQSDIGELFGSISGIAILLAVLTARQPIKKTTMSKIRLTLRQLHGPIGLLAFLMAFVHWQPKFNGISGMLGISIMSLIVLPFLYRPLRRIRFLQIWHKWAGYILLCIVLFHAYQAFFTSGN